MFSGLNLAPGTHYLLLASGATSRQFIGWGLPSSYVYAHGPDVTQSTVVDYYDLEPDGIYPPNHPFTPYRFQFSESIYSVTGMPLGYRNQDR